MVVFGCKVVSKYLCYVISDFLRVITFPECSMSLNGSQSSKYT